MIKRNSCIFGKHCICSINKMLYLTGPGPLLMIASQLRRGMFQRISCLNNCQAPDSCPSMEKIRNATMSASRECRACIRDACGKFRLQYSTFNVSNNIEMNSFTQIHLLTMGGPTKHRKGTTKDLLNTAKYDKGLQIKLINTAKNDKGLGIIP